MSKPDTQTEELLTLSLEQYRKLLQHAENLLRMFDSCDFSQVDEEVLSLNQLQAAVKEQDEQLLPLLQADLDIWKDDARFQKRLDYMNSILKLNESLVPKIRGIMAVTSVELKKMRSGRTALTGYSSQSSRQRGLRGVG